MSAPRLLAGAALALALVPSVAAAAAPGAGRIDLQARDAAAGTPMPVDVRTRGPVGACGITLRAAGASRVVWQARVKAAAAMRRTWRVRVPRATPSGRYLVTVRCARGRAAVPVAVLPARLGLRVGDVQVAAVPGAVGRYAWVARVSNPDARLDAQVVGLTLSVRDARGRARRVGGSTADEAPAAGSVLLAGTFAWTDAAGPPTGVVATPTVARTRPADGVTVRPRVDGPVAQPDGGAPGALVTYALTPPVPWPRTAFSVAQLVVRDAAGGLVSVDEAPIPVPAAGSAPVTMQHRLVGGAFTGPLTFEVVVRPG